MTPQNENRPNNKNALYYGDNLDILRRYIKDETIDLIYLDPPFKSNRNYNVLFEEQDGSRPSAQIEVFKDTWQWSIKSAKTYEEIVEAGDKVSRIMQAFHTFLGESDMLAYLAMMAPRLVELKRVLKPTGSIYLHCDPTASAHLRLLMDSIFDPRNLQNEIIWGYRTGGVSKRRFARKHDTILFYGKNKQPKFYPMKERIYYEKPFFVSEQDENGKYFADVYIRDVWDDVKPVINVSSERLGYPTQKPETLLERIIEASSNEGDTVLDPFCGCGTAVAVAHRLKRRWVGIDITHLATTLIKHRLQDTFGDKVSETYEEIGEPKDLSGAQELASSGPYQFQWWALGLVGARPVEQKKGADKGIDGRLYFHDEPDSKKTKTKQIIFSVKAGHTQVSHIRDLRGVIEREKAQIGVLISMENPTKPMITEAASAGFYKSPWGKYSTLQILTIQELLNGKGLDCPPLGQVDVTFKKAQRAKGKPKKQLMISQEIERPNS